MYRLLILMFSASAVCNLSMAQSNISEYYRPVDIDSLLLAPVSLPEDKPFIIQNVEFTLLSSQMKPDITKISPVVRDRFIQFNNLFPDQNWVYQNTSTYFKVADSTLVLTVGKPGQFDKLMEIYKNKEKDV